MESCALCEKCNNSTSSCYLFSCNHTLCSCCITRIIGVSHMKSIAHQDQIEITCSCTKGKRNFTVADIPQLLNNSKSITTCLTHGAAAQLYCLRCEQWLCDECLRIHDQINASHPRTKEQVNLKRCNIHPGQLKDIYCHDCKETICSLCAGLKSARHFNHNYQSIKEYADELRTQIPSFDVTAQINRLEEMRKDFKEKFGDILRSTVMKMDKLVKVIEESKLIYTRKMKQSFQKTELLLDLAKFFYLDITSSQANLDITLLKELCAWNMECLKLDIQDDTDIKLQKLQDELKECIQNSPQEAIQLDWMQMNWNKISQKLTGHEEWVVSLIQMKDGRVVSGSADNTIRVWDLKGKEFFNSLTLPGHGGTIWALIKLRDGRIASGSADYTIKIWKITENEFDNTQTLIGHTETVRSLIEMKDGRIASGSDDRLIKIWKANKNEIFDEILNLNGHKSWVCALLQLKDGRIASGSKDNTFIVWEVKENEFRIDLIVPAHTNSVSSLIQLTDGRIVSGSSDQTIKVWDVKEKEFNSSLTGIGHEGNIWSVIQLADGRIASGSSDNTVKVWKITERGMENTVTLNEHKNWVWSIIQLKDGRIASGSRDNSIIIWQ